jgi:hypothetical protein
MTELFGVCQIQIAPPDDIVFLRWSKALAVENCLPETAEEHVVDVDALLFVTSVVSVTLSRIKTIVE